MLSERRGIVYLSDELFADLSIVFRAESLLEEGEEDGDNDAAFEALSEADEEYLEGD